MNIPDEAILAVALVGAVVVRAGEAAVKAVLAKVVGPKPEPPALPAPSPRAALGSRALGCDGQCAHAVALRGELERARADLDAVRTEAHEELRGNLERVLGGIERGARAQDNVASVLERVAEGLDRLGGAP